MQRKKYIFGILLAVAVIAVNQSFIQYWLHKKNQDSRIINLSGRQRMLSQKVSIEFHQFKEGQSTLDQVKKYNDEWRQIHYALLNGDAAIEINAVDDEVARNLLAQLNENVEYISILLDKASYPSDIDINTIDKNQETFLNRMDLAVKSLELSSDRKLRFIVLVEIILAVLSIIILSLEVIYIYLPIEKKFSKTVERLSTSENKLRAIMDSTNNSHILIGTDFQILSFNKKAQKNSKLLLHKELKEGNEIWEYLIDIEKEVFKKNATMALSGQSASHQIETNFNKTTQWFEVSYLPAYGKSDELIGVTFSSTNIDRRKEAEKKIKAQNERLAEQNRKLKQIAWEQSHETRRPLANILIFLDLLKSDKEADQERKDEYLEFLSQSAQQLDEIVERITNNTVEKQES
ncbi:type IV pili methyl-accepting chemotaxis transducer N-terminal domain-containing protein [Roseivirga sp.]|uniref:type IV pili methyl-accepting chemotaxis transducer N-terminal domain-containing protein n=1 Tax=Roseivirga sp. TaxID=1964215 RepID=UPI002B265B2E|nr:type IV pili methyl-accepting chemotaxis transducer N-terminal domain-containing protein [Roseivirga sp.]